MRAILVEFFQDEHGKFEVLNPALFEKEVLK